MPGQWNEHDLLWGVGRHTGLSDADDPQAHAGVVQHAFELGNDSRAICGYQPPRRRSMVASVPRAQLAVAGPANPRCKKCDALISHDVPSARAPGWQVRVPGAATPALQANVGQADEVSGTGAGNPLDEAQAVLPLDLPWVEPPQPEPAPAAADAHASRNASPRPRRRRRSVRRGGTRTILAGRRSMTIRVPALLDGAGIVANLIDAPADIRVSSVSLKTDGTARINLNQPAGVPLTVTWFIVATLEHTLPDGDPADS